MYLDVVDSSITAEVWTPYSLDDYVEVMTLGRDIHSLHSPQCIIDCLGEMVQQKLLIGLWLRNKIWENIFLSCQTFL